LGTLLLLASVFSLQYLVGSFGYSCTIFVCSRAILVLQISPYSLLLCLTTTHPVITFIQVKIGCQSLCPCAFLFHYQGLHQFSLREITITESNFFEEITTPSEF
jgi:hypothetical protein